MQTAIIKVNALSFLQIIPPFTPPQTTALPAQTPQTDSAAVTEFGGTNSGATSTESTSTTSGGTTVFNSDTDYIQSGFVQESQSTNFPISNSNVLWGAAATAMLGATLADWQRKREEEEARKRAEAAAQEQGGGGSGKKTPGQRAYEAMMKQKHIVGASQALLDERANEKAEQSEQARQSLIAKNKDKAPVDMAKVNQLVQAESARQALISKNEDKAPIDMVKVQQLVQNNIDVTRRIEVASVVQAKQENQPWWKDILDWVDKHQGVSSMGVGAIVGTVVAAIGLSVVTVVSLPIVLAIAATAAVTAGLVVLAGTYGLNTYYDRPRMENVIPNILAGSATAFVVAGVGFALFSGLITQTIITGGNAIGALCTANPQACTQISPIIDNFEQGSLAVQLAIQKITGDEEGAAETYVQYQAELLDGGVPGNTVFAELADLGDDVPELVAEYGDEIIPLLLKYGDDAEEIISKYGNDGIKILVKSGDNAKDAIVLVKEYGPTAIELLNSMDYVSAKKLLDNLDTDLIVYAIGQGPEALETLPFWSEKELREFGPDLVLRSKKDAQVFKDIKELISLGELDPKNPSAEQKRLIRLIAENSMQYTENGQIVLGKWVDYGNGFTKVARETGSVHYNPHPEMWNMFKSFGADREEAAWLVNQQVIQIGIEQKLPFEYTLDGIPEESIAQEKAVVEMIFEGATNEDIIKELGLSYVSVRWKELQEMQSAGYQIAYDEEKMSYIFILP